MRKVIGILGWRGNAQERQSHGTPHPHGSDSDLAGEEKAAVHWMPEKLTGFRRPMILSHWASKEHPSRVQAWRGDKKTIQCQHWEGSGKRLSCWAGTAVSPRDHKLGRHGGAEPHQLYPHLHC